MLNYDPGIVVVWREMCAQEGAAQAEPLRAERKALQNKTWELQHTWTPEEVRCGVCVCVVVVGGRREMVSWALLSSLILAVGI